MRRNAAQLEQEPVGSEGSLYVIELTGNDDLPCPWCSATTSVTDPRCPSCSRRFG